MTGDPLNTPMDIIRLRITPGLYDQLLLQARIKAGTPVAAAIAFRSSDSRVSALQMPN